MKNNQMIMVIVLAIIVGAAGFFGGMKYQETKSPGVNPNRQFQAGRQGGQNGQSRFTGGRPIMGEIISSDDKSITVKLQDGSSKIVLLPDSVTVSKTDTASKADLKVGVKVGVFGMENSDKSVTAQNVQLNPMFRAGQGAQGSPSGSPR